MSRIGRVGFSAGADNTDGLHVSILRHCWVQCTWIKIALCGYLISWYLCLEGLLIRNLSYEIGCGKSDGCLFNVGGQRPSLSSNPSKVQRCKGPLGNKKSMCKTYLLFLYIYFAPR